MISLGADNTLRTSSWLLVRDPAGFIWKLQRQVKLAQGLKNMKWPFNDVVIWIKKCQWDINGRMASALSVSVPRNKQLSSWFPTTTCSFPSRHRASWQRLSKTAIFLAFVTLSLSGWTIDMANPNKIPFPGQEISLYLLVVKTTCLLISLKLRPRSAATLDCMQRFTINSGIKGCQTATRL